MRQAYLQERGKRNAKIFPKDFSERLELWLSELTTNRVVKGRPQFWTLKGYALAHKINPNTFMAWFRKLEEVAKKLYPERVPSERRDKPPLSDAKIRIIRNEYLATGKILEIAKRHELDPWRVGQLCRAEKQIRAEAAESNRANREQLYSRLVPDDSNPKTSL